MNALTIGKLAESAGVSVETVRFYQRKGLLDVPEGRGGIRYYDEPYQRRLGFIRHAQAAGFTLAEIGELLELDAGGGHERAQQLAWERIAVLDEKIAAMQSARDSLKRLANRCEAAGPDEPCVILRAFDY